MGIAGSVFMATAAPPNLPSLNAGAALAPKTHGCLIEPDRIAEIGTQVVGLVDRIRADRGDFVTAGQPVVELRADVERANVSVADTRSRIDADVRSAAASLELADQKVRRAQKLVTENFVSEQAVEQARAEREVARQKLAQTRGQLKIWQEERQVAEAQLRLRTVRSPLSGIIVERYVNQGERVEDRPLMRVAVVDPLRVELMVPTSQYGSFHKGDAVTVQPELPGVGPLTATVAQIDRAMDAASNSFRVRLTLPNPKGELPSGLRCKAELPAASASRTPAPAVPSPAVWHGAGGFMPASLSITPREPVVLRTPPPAAARSRELPIGVGAPLALRLTRSL